MKLTIEYDPNEGRKYADGEFEKVAMMMYLYFKKINLPRGINGWYQVANITLIDAFRALIAEGKIDPFYILFKYKDKTFTSNENGICAEWPKELSGPSLDFSSRILRVQLKKLNI
jgi:hypothetical protein